VLKKLKEGASHSQVFEDLYAIFFKDSKNPNSYDKVDLRRECIKKLISPWANKIRLEATEYFKSRGLSLE
jgi:hypothetical protein